MMNGVEPRTRWKRVVCPVCNGRGKYLTGYGHWVDPCDDCNGWGFVNGFEETNDPDDSR